MSQLFRRVIEVSIGNKKWTYPELEISFTVKFDTTSVPCECDVSIFNLSDDSIAEIKTGQPIVLSAGYEGDIGTILEGVIADASLEKNGVDRELKIKAYNVSDQYLSKQIAYTYGPDTDSEYLIRDVLKYVGLTPNILELKNPQVYPLGFAAYGSIKSVLEQLAGDADSKIIINNSSIKIVPENGGEEIGFLLNYKSGLLDISAIDKTDTPAKYKVKTMLIHALNSYTIIKVESNTFNGLAIVADGQHSSSDFTSEFEIVPL